MAQVLLFVFTAALTSAAQLAMKKGVDGLQVRSLTDLTNPELWMRPWLLGSLVMYATSAALYLVMLSRTEVGRLYPAFLGACILTVLAGSALAGLERISLTKALGAVLVFGGIVVLHLKQ